MGVGDSCAQPQVRHVGGVEPSSRGRSKVWPGRGVVEEHGPHGYGGKIDFGTLVEAAGTTDAMREGALGGLAV